jgi:hypothetical protein
MLTARIEQSTRLRRQVLNDGAEARDRRKVRSPVIRITPTTKRTNKAAPVEICQQKRAQFSLARPPWPDMRAKPAFLHGSLHGATRARGLHPGRMRTAEHSHKSNIKSIWYSGCCDGPAPEETAIEATVSRRFSSQFVGPCLYAAARYRPASRAMPRSGPVPAWQAGVPCGRWVRMY